MSEMRNHSDSNYTVQDIEALPEGTRAELIHGQLYMMASPSRIHQKLVVRIVVMIRNYIDDHHGTCEVYPGPFAVRLFADDSTYLEPDISVICDLEKLDDRGCNGAPDWVIEVVSPSSNVQDYYRKQMLYQRSGVKLYWVVNPETEKTLVFEYRTVRFAEYGFDESIPVELFPGLAIRIQDFLE